MKTLPYEHWTGSPRRHGRGFVRGLLLGLLFAVPTWAVAALIAWIIWWRVPNGG